VLVLRLENCKVEFELKGESWETVNFCSWGKQNKQLQLARLATAACDILGAVLKGMEG
jgi:hypothetical protein